MECSVCNKSFKQKKGLAYHLDNGGCQKVLARRLEDERLRRKVPHLLFEEKLGEKRIEEEERRFEEEKRIEEERRLEEEKRIEGKRLEEEKRLELEDIRIEEEKRIELEEGKRIELEEEKRIELEEKRRIEEKRLEFEEERRIEEKRLELEEKGRIEEKRLEFEEERRIEENRLEFEETLREERRFEEKLFEEKFEEKQKRLLSCQTLEKALLNKISKKNERVDIARQLTSVVQQKKQKADMYASVGKQWLCERTRQMGYYDDPNLSDFNNSVRFFRRNLRCREPTV